MRDRNEVGIRRSIVALLVLLVVALSQTRVPQNPNLRSTRRVERPSERYTALRT